MRFTHLHTNYAKQSIVVRIVFAWILRILASKMLVFLRFFEVLEGLESGRLIGKQ